MTTDKRQKSDRREGSPEAPVFGELLLESGWTPEDPQATGSENWLRTKGLAPERRSAPRRK